MSTPNHNRRVGRSRPVRALAGTGLAAALVCFTMAAFTLPAAASGETVTVTPSASLTDAQNVTVTFTMTAATEATVFIGITQCGNATSAGTPLAAAGANDCMGAAGLGTTLVTFGATGAGGLAGPVPAGSHTVTLKTKKTGLGTNNAQCIPLAQATIPCRVSAATATFAGGYTGPGYNFTASADISYAGAATTTTTAAQTTTTTVAPTTTTTTGGGTTTTTTGGGATTTTAAPATTTTTAAPTTTTTAAPATTTTAPATTKTFDCNDIPLPTSALVMSKNRCLAPGATVTLSAPAGAFKDPGSAFVLQCNPDATIPADGSGCNVGGLGVGVVGADGSLAPTDLVVKTGAVGSDPRSVCPPTQTQADAGIVNCIFAAAPGGDSTKALSAAFTVAGQTVELPVDPSGNPTTPTTSPAGSGGGNDADVLGTTQTTQTTAAAVTPAGSLPYTGLGGNTWFIVGMAILLIDAGAVASSYAKRRMVG